MGMSISRLRYSVMRRSKEGLCTEESRLITNMDDVLVGAELAESEGSLSTSSTSACASSVSSRIVAFVLIRPFPSASLVPGYTLTLSTTDALGCAPGL